MSGTGVAPPGGLFAQVLTKSTDADYMVFWADVFNYIDGGKPSTSYGQFDIFLTLDGGPV